MDGRRLFHIEKRCKPKELQAAIEEILEEINDCAAKPYLLSQIVACFCQIDSLRWLKNSGLRDHVDRIEALIVDGCEPDPEPIDYSERRMLTAHEREVYNTLCGLGCIVLRNGWPDFLVIHRESGRILAVEAKAAKSAVSNAQRVVHSTLKKAGIQVVVARNPKTIARQMKRAHNV